MEAIVGLGIIEAFSYVLLYYTFIHSLNRYERKKDKIFYIAASLAVVVRLAAIVLDKEKTAVCMDIYLPCTILQTVLLLGMNVQTSNAFCRLSLGMNYIFYVFEKNTVCQHNYFWSRSDGLLCSIYFQAATAQNGYECSDSRFYLDYNYYHKSAVLWISVPV